MMSDPKVLIRLIFRADVAFFVYFFFVAFLGLGGEGVHIVYILFLPWLMLAIFFLHLPMLALLLRPPRLGRSVKVNHVLEHGTIHFLKTNCCGKRRIGGKALRHGFRIYGEIESKKDIEEAFERLRAYLAGHETAAVLSKRCGSSLPVSQAFSFILLTLTTFCFLLTDLTLSRACALLISNVIIYVSFRTLLGKYVQMKLLMCFDFTNPVLVSVKSTSRKGIFERSPVYEVRTRYDM